jgi:3-phenylpropionate/cinnamic acid dioxygenase small subunit
MNLEQRLSELEERVSRLEKEAAAATTANVTLDSKKIANVLVQAIEDEIIQAFEARRRRTGPSRS